MKVLSSSLLALQQVTLSLKCGNLRETSYNFNLLYNWQYNQPLYVTILHTVKNGFEMRVCWAQLHFSIPAEWNDPEAGPSPRVTRTNIYNPNLGFASLTCWWRIEMFTFNLFVAKLKTGKAATNILHPTSNLNIECCTQRERVIFLVANREIKTSLFSRLQCLHSLL